MARRVVNSIFSANCPSPQPRQRAPMLRCRFAYIGNQSRIGIEQYSGTSPRHQLRANCRRECAGITAVVRLRPRPVRRADASPDLFDFPTHGGTATPSTLMPLR